MIRCKGKNITQTEGPFAAFPEVVLKSSVFLNCPDSFVFPGAHGEGAEGSRTGAKTDRSIRTWDMAGGGMGSGDTGKATAGNKKSADVRGADAGNVSKNTGRQGSRKERKQAGIYLMPDRIYEKCHMILPKWMEFCSLRGDFSAMYRVPDNGNVSEES